MVITNLSGEKIIYPQQQLHPIRLTTRLKNTLITLIKCIAITALMSLIPVLHFVLVPLGCFLTMINTWLSWKRSYFFEQIEIHCPSCDQKTTASLGGSELPLRTFCPSCRNMVYVAN